jgi:hypothetical protein
VATKGLRTAKVIGGGAKAGGLQVHTVNTKRASADKQQRTQ